jgi:hypothetical protein
MSLHGLACFRAGALELAVLSFRPKDKRILLGNADEIFGLIQMLAILRRASEMAIVRPVRV